MNMHSVAEANPGFTSHDVENSLDGNICRCTGFRPILDAFKTLSADPHEDLRRKCLDIEDVYKCPLKNAEAKQLLDNKFEIVQVPKNVYLKSANGEQWFKVTTLAMLYEIIQNFSYSQITYKLVAGNTGIGVYKNDGPYVGYIDINHIPELKKSSVDQSGIVLGGNVTLTWAMDLFKLAPKTDGFVYTEEFYNLFLRIAGHPVRNRGTLAGNLMMKHAHKEFPSEIFLLFESIGATLKIGTSMTSQQEYTLIDFLNLDMTGKVILSIHLPVFEKERYLYKCFKIGKRHKNTQAIVNAAFLFEIDTSNSKILSRPRICYGGINPNFVHANNTEEYLDGKQLNISTIQGAMKMLENELVPDSELGNSKPAYRIGLAQSYLYKFILQILGNDVDPRLRSGAYEIERTLTSGKQTFETDRLKWPLNQPIPKMDSLAQVSGEAKYINDICSELAELHGAFVVTTVGNATIKSVDASEALSVAGVVAFYSAKDVPGRNNATAFLPHPEMIFIENEVKYAGQAVGLIVATDKDTALAARSKVIIQYENVQKPILSISSAVEGDKTCSDISKLKLSLPYEEAESTREKNVVLNIAKTKTKRDEVKGNLHKVKGEFQTHGQYHFHLEPQVCICIPTEDGMTVHSSTQWMNFTQAAVASCLNLPNNSVTVEVRRLGGGFGAKSTRSALIATACAVAAHHTQKPVRVDLDLETNMQMIGKRLPYLVQYEATVDDLGKIHTLKSKIYCDAGHVPNEPTVHYGMICSQSCYHENGWDVTPGVALTNTAANTFCSAPGSSQGVAIIETIMEHIAYTVEKDPLEVRQINFIQKGDPFIGVPGAKLLQDNLLPRMISELQNSADLNARMNYVKMFNKSNRWRKRGISVVPQRYPNYYYNTRYPTFISVYPSDGTVNLTHGGIEMGQGLNTKVAQVVAYTLKIPLEKVKVAPSNNLVSLNTSATVGSMVSELVCSSAQKACEQLLERLSPVKKFLHNPTWEQLIAAATGRNILLTSQFQHKKGDVKSYDVWGVTATEVEIDVLTGDFKIVRVDLIEDAGESISPLVDIGQIEGAFVMGLSWWLTEELIYDQNSGELITDRTWNYKPMLASDIPEDFRVTLLRNAPNPFGVFGSKATGEPPLNMSCSVIFALRNAIDSARREAGNHSWYQMDGPVTREVIRQLSLVSPHEFNI
ncbi:unnamed protein product [Orchesella dallaii]|uniref:FAD-binding PCMH-type domain-containing protein n=1 Tax=Orchesella dallaii TaxID=48710 RepID=A0ABP1QYI2_9HEXA